MISPAAKERAEKLIQSGVDEGADLLLDGRDFKVKGYEKGNFLAPTIITKVTVNKTIVTVVSVNRNLPALQ